MLAFENVPSPGGCSPGAARPYRPWMTRLERFLHRAVRVREEIRDGVVSVGRRGGLGEPDKCVFSRKTRWTSAETKSSQICGRGEGSRLRTGARRAGAKPFVPGDNADSSVDGRCASWTRAWCHDFVIIRGGVALKSEAW